MTRLGLTTRLVGMMAVLFLLSIAASYGMYSHSDAQLLREFQDTISDLSTAIQVSVEEITSKGATSQARLRDVVRQLKRKGVREISILSPEEEVIASSNPGRVGARVDPKHKDLLITAQLGEKGPSSGPHKTFNLLVPVVVENEQWGYAHFILTMDDMESLLHALHVKRLLITVGIFALGIAASVILSWKYTKPISEVVDAAKHVAAGDLSRTLPENRRDEIGELTKSFNEMVVRLRTNRELEERLRQAEHFSSLGQLATGIAHEIRNPLNLIKLTIDHLHAQLSPPLDRSNEQRQQDAEKNLALLATVKQEIHRLNQMVEQFLRYGRPVRLEKRSVDGVELVHDVLDLARPQLNEQNIRVCEDLPGDSPTLSADRELLKTCLMNVVMNAIQAMPDGGTLSVSLRADPVSQTVRMTVDDTGPGVPEEHLAKIFVPYFTTKKIGIGLGLALTRRIIEEHGGRIDVSNRPEGGSRFVLALPIGSPEERTGGGAPS